MSVINQKSTARRCLVTACLTLGLVAGAAASGCATSPDADAGSIGRDVGIDAAIPSDATVSADIIPSDATVSADSIASDATVRADIIPSDATVGADSAALVTIVPVETPFAVFRNPGMGWLPYAFDPVRAPTLVQMTPYASTVYSNYFTWADLEPMRGVYNFSAIDAFINTWAATGRRVKIGIHVTDPTSIPRPHVPLWYLALPDSGRWYRTWYGIPIAADYAPYPGQTPGYDFEPHYADPRFIVGFGRLLDALAERYRASASWQAHLEGIDISTFGFWGEWHSEYVFQNNTREPTLRTLVDQYFHAFARGPAPRFTMNVLGQSLTPSDNLTADRNSVRYALERGAHPVRRCIGICNTGLLTTDERMLITRMLDDVDRPRIFHGEWGSWDGRIAAFYNRPGGVLSSDTEGAIDEALSLRANYLGWYVREEWVPIRECPPWAGPEDCGDNPSGRFVRVLAQPTRRSGRFESLEDYAQRRLGYRLVLGSLQHPAVLTPGVPFSVRHTWFQRGVGRVPWPLGFVVCLERARERFCAAPDRTFNPSRWPVGERRSHEHTSVLTTPMVSPGRYALLIALVRDDDDTPFVSLAIEGRTEPDRNRPSFYRLSTVDVR